MSSRNPLKFHPLVERLEDRLTPVVNSVTTSLTAGSLHISAASGNETVVITSLGADSILITPDAGTSIDGGAAGAAVARGFTKDLIVTFAAGTDELDFNGPGSLSITGNLSVNMGTGGFKELTNNAEVGVPMVGLDLTVGGDFTVDTGAVTSVEIELINFHVGGNMSVNHANGTSSVDLDTIADPLNNDFNSVHGNFSITNTITATGKPGAGIDLNTVNDTDVNGNVLMDLANPGPLGIAGTASWTVDAGPFPPKVQSDVNGSFTVNSKNGLILIDVEDTNVALDVSLNAGGGLIKAISIGTFESAASVSIGGNLSITAKGVSNFSQVDSVQIGGDFSIHVTGGINVLSINDVIVGWDTSITTGNGSDFIFIDSLDTITAFGTADPVGSTFNGNFSIATGKGRDSVAIASDFDGDFDGQSTVFNGKVNVNLGGGADTLALATGGFITFSKPKAQNVFDGGPQSDTLVLPFPFNITGNFTLLNIP
jgi:hypothetical protein